MIYKPRNIRDLLSGNRYPGRGIIIGLTPDGRRAAICYFIMGRSDNSRNRVFEETGEDLMIKPFDPSKVEDPSLIIYYPIRALDKGIIVTNGDQTDTVFSHIKDGSTFEEALRTRTFEPDPPNWTPRISGIAGWKDKMSYRLSILKSADAGGTACTREFFEYEAMPGTGHFIHTYEEDGDPLPTFSGEPRCVTVPEDAEAMAEEIWNSLDEDNRISLYVRYIDTETGETRNVLKNKNS